MVRRENSAPEREPMKKVMLILGTRPEAVKMCPLVPAIAARGMRPVVLLTGQHRQMPGDVLAVFGIKPAYCLDLMEEGEGLSQLTARILEGVDDILKQERPDIALVHGDTVTAFASAVACFFLGVPFGHVEAGLRTYNMKAPFPEEFNRRAVSLAARLHFAPTEGARQNLLKEGIPARDIFVTGNTGIDTLRATVKKDYIHPAIAWAKGSRLLFFTAHRRENQGEKMCSMFRALRRIVGAFPDLKAICPLHPNPLVQAAAKKVFPAGGREERILLTEPLDMVACHNIMARATFILTDSGGIQEEAAFLGKPVLVMRTTTERPEGLSCGAARLVGTEEESIFRESAALLTDPATYAAMARAGNPYGDGFAARRVAEVLYTTEE